MPYDGRYGQVAKAMKKKRAYNRFGKGHPCSMTACPGKDPKPKTTKKMGPKSPMPTPQDSSHPIKREKKDSARGFRSFKSIIKGNVMGMRPPKRLAPQSEE